MNYLPYVISAYAVFVAVLSWDFLAPRLRIRRELRAARQRQAREQPSRRDAPPEELSR